MMVCFDFCWVVCFLIDVFVCVNNNGGVFYIFNICELVGGM